MVYQMCTEKERHVLLNINRTMIYCFGLLGLFYDYTWAYVISMTLWVWLPNCLRFEKTAYDYCKSYYYPPVSKSTKLNE